MSIEIKYFENRKDWRKWLNDNFEIANEVWFVFPSKSSGEKSITYNDAVEEALCFEWIDSTIKPLDKEAVLQAAQNTRLVVTIEEHAPYGGLGSMVSQVIASQCPRKVVNLSLPDTPVVAGESNEVFEYYGLDASGIAKTVLQGLNR